MTRHTTQENDAMRLDIRGWNLSVSPALLDRVERRLRIALRRLAAAPFRVAVRIADEDGGVRKSCLIHVQLPGRSVTIEEVDDDLFAAVDGATARDAG